MNNTENTFVVPSNAEEGALMEEESGAVSAQEPSKVVNDPVSVADEGTADESEALTDAPEEESGAASVQEPAEAVNDPVSDADEGTADESKALTDAPEEESGAASVQEPAEAVNDPVSDADEGTADGGGALTDDKDGIDTAKTEAAMIDEQGSSGNNDDAALKADASENDALLEEQTAVKTEVSPDNSDSYPFKKRKPYHELNYLMYGFESVPEELKLTEALSFLKEIGYDNGPLHQARTEKDTAKKLADIIAQNSSGHYCDFCWTPLTGVDFDILADGRERCASCRRTAVKTVAEFEDIYESVKKNLAAFFGARIDVPIFLEMVNAKTLHKKVGLRFNPTVKPDARALGYAIPKGKNKRFIIRIENGSPKVRAIMTMAHEMTHIWQFTNWDEKKINKKYGRNKRLEVYEGMAKWVEIQYTYLIGETDHARREELNTMMREDEYGRGFLQYLNKYPLTYGTILDGQTPFDDKDSPL